MRTSSSVRKDVFSLPRDLSCNTLFSIYLNPGQFKHYLIRIFQLICKASLSLVWLPPDLFNIPWFLYRNWLFITPFLILQVPPYVPLSTLKHPNLSSHSQKDTPLFPSCIRSYAFLACLWLLRKEYYFCITHHLISFSVS